MNNSISCIQVCKYYFSKTCTKIIVPGVTGVESSRFWLLCFWRKLKIIGRPFCTTSGGGNSSGQCLRFKAVSEVKLPGGEEKRLELKVFLKKEHFSDPFLNQKWLFGQIKSWAKIDLTSYQAKAPNFQTSLSLSNQQTLPAQHFCVPPPSLLSPSIPSLPIVDSPSPTLQLTCFFPPSFNMSHNQ